MTIEPILISRPPTHQSDSSAADSCAASRSASGRVPSVPRRGALQCSARVVVQGRSALVEAAPMPGLPELEPLVVQMVAQLVAEHAQESPEGSDLFENSRGS